MNLISKRPMTFNWEVKNKSMPSTSTRNRYARQVLTTNFTSFVDKREQGYFFKGTNKLLISPSALMHTINRSSMSKIPPHILEARKEIGTNLMVNLKTMFDSKLYDPSELLINERDRKMVSNIMDFFMKENIRIEAVEKFITNGELCGFVDVIGWWNKHLCVFEIKCRNKDEIRLSDVVQTCIYKRMLNNMHTYILLLADNGEVKFYNAPQNRRFIYYGAFEKTMRYYKEMGVLENEKVQPILFD